MRVGSSRSRDGAALVVAVLAAAGLESPAGAGPAASVGYEHYSGPAGQTVRALAAAAATSIRGTEAVVVGVRYDDAFVGRGVHVAAGLGVPLGPSTALRMQAGRLIGDERYRAWRARVGPQLALPGGASVLLSYVRYQDNQDLAADAVAVESTAPVSPRITARLNASHTAAPGVRSTQGAIGLSWVAVPHLELSGEVGVARNGAGVAGGPPSLTAPLPILGGRDSGADGSAASSGPEVSPTILLGVRLLFP